MRIGVAVQVILRRRQMQLVVGQPLHREVARYRRADGNGDVGLALGQVEDARLGDDLHLKPRVIGADLRDDLRQKIVRAAVGRAHPDLPGQARPLGPHLLHRLGHRLFHAGRMRQKALPLAGRRIALGRAGEKPRRHPFLKPCDAPPHRRGIEFEHLARPRQAFRPRDGKEDLQVVPVRHGCLLCKNAKHIWETASFPSNSARLFCARKIREA